MSTVSLERLIVDTHDIDQVTHLINSLHLDHKPRLEISDRGRARSRIESATVGDLNVGTTHWRGVGYHATVDDCEDRLLASVVAGGRASLSTAAEDARVLPGDVLLCTPGAPYESYGVDSTYRLVQIPRDSAQLIATERTGSTERLEFFSARPVSTARGKLWVDTTRYVLDVVGLADDSLPTLLLDEMIRLLSTTLLRVFPNSTMTMARPLPQRSVPVRALDRAVAFIEEYASLPLADSDIASTARAGTTDLRTAFLRAFGVSPQGYVRRVRLEAAHAELRAGEPDEVAALAIVRRWGFVGVPAYRKAYRDMFGTDPDGLTGR